MAALNLVGQRFGLLVVLQRGENSNSGKTRWICQCDCGSKPRLVTGSNLRSGISTSCGCVRKERALVAATSHGHTRGRRISPTYNTWRAMMSRCQNPNDKSYPYYGGRGVSVCARWQSFEAFFEDMGERPEKAEIDRQDNFGDYEPGNCRWVTKSQNGRNRRTNREIDTPVGRILLCEAAELSGIKAATLLQRADRGWPAERMFDAERKLDRLDERVIPTPEGPMRMADASRRFGIKVPTISTRIMAGWPEDRWLEPPRRRNKKG